MLVTAIEGVVVRGQIRLLENISLPENTPVYVIMVDTPTESVANRLVHREQAGDFRKQVLEIPPDLETEAFHQDQPT